MITYKLDHTAVFKKIMTLVPLVYLGAFFYVTSA